MTATEDPMDASHGAAPMCVSLMRSDASQPPMKIPEIGVDRILHDLGGGSGPSAEPALLRSKAVRTFVGDCPRDRAGLARK